MKIFFLVVLLTVHRFDSSFAASTRAKRLTGRLSGIRLRSQCTSGVGEIRLLFYSLNGNATEVDLDTPGSVPVDPSLETVWVIHGFLSYGTKDWINDTVSALLNRPRNVFVLDWRVGACAETVRFLNIQSYGSAANNTREVGEYLAGCLERLVNNYSVLLKDIWVIGHSLGAHVAGFAGKAFQRHFPNFKRITGLDPAGPLFRGLNSTERLDKTDASFVEVIHTSSLLGLQEPIGHIDFYYNGGEFQPSCLLKKPGCSHDRAVDYYLEAIRNASCQFIGKAWSKEKAYRNTPTTCVNSCASVGPAAVYASARGTFYVQTNNREPFCTDALPTTGSIVAAPQGSAGGNICGDLNGGAGSEDEPCLNHDFTW
ncbi:phospholipase A1-like [Athalia rosae]|uniref:phospholipase A1-like n=1 Tax=Athalia rosae TaxID=37344 RepID=UPI002034423D|nr:phospholipase A1-like [Athalia rosae]